MNALILMAMLAGTPECPTILIAAGGDELVIRKLDPRVNVSILTSPPKDSSSAVIHWGEFFIEFERTMTKVERRRFLSATRICNDIMSSYRKTVEAAGGTWTKETRKPFEELESFFAEIRTRESERLSNTFRANVTKEGDKWAVTSRRDLLAEVFVDTGSPQRRGVPTPP